jgi:hypothetical protein
MPGDDWWALLEDRFDLARLIIRNIAVAVHEARMRPPPHGGFEPGSTAIVAPRRLNLVERLLVLRAVPLFARGSFQALTVLAEGVLEGRAAAGGVLFARGALKGHLAVVVSGRVIATRDAPELTARFGPGDLVAGPTALVHAEDYEVRAETDVQVMCVPIEEYFDTMEEHFSLVRSAIGALAEERELLLER